MVLELVLWQFYGHLGHGWLHLHLLPTPFFILFEFSLTFTSSGEVKELMVPIAPLKLQLTSAIRLSCSEGYLQELIP